jgi:transketolase
MDAVQQANSGHPGMPMGMADIAECLWNRQLRHNPADPAWPDRDRFVLSNGHGSMLLYALLHLTGYALPIEELRRFRQLHAQTPGHPEYGCTPGVETTTGPLGQGLANAVGMALAERMLAAEFNRPGFEIVNHRTWVFAGDGCLMEGISHEACSLAGTLGLGKLVVFYDDNGISIDGRVSGWFTDDTAQRFAAYGWRVIGGVDGHSPESVDAAITQALSDDKRPALICCKTVIAKGAPNKQDTHDAHGAPLGAAEVAAAREALGWPHAPFEVPAEIYAGWDGRPRGAQLQARWHEVFAAYASAHPQAAAEFRRRMAGELPASWHSGCEAFLADVSRRAENIATRKASQNAIEALGKALPELVGGSADLSGSNLTYWSGAKPVRSSGGGNYIYFGVREFAMGAMVNGIALHGGFVPYGATFLVFSDYERNALRMAALMQLRTIHVFTHDSIGLGEDGPTHQPVEHAAALRLIPGMQVWRPCDSIETAVAWIAAIERSDAPTSLLLSRQNLPFQPRTPAQLAGISRGAYVLADAAAGRPDCVLIATGSEVALALDAQRKLEEQGVRTRVVSMPSTSVFDRQDAEYRAAILPHGVPRVAVEAGSADYWRKYVGLEGAVVGLERFGESAPASEVYKYLGITSDAIVKAATGITRPPVRGGA